MTSKDNKKTNKNSFPLFAVLLVLVVIALLSLSAYTLYQVFLRQPPPLVEEASPAIPSPPAVVTDPSLPSSQEKEPQPSVELHQQLYEPGTIGPDQERREYQDASLILRIPRLNYQGAVLEGMTKELKSGNGAVNSAMDETALDHGVVLFNQSQLPGTENRNVSIAGHRDILGMEFYYIDTFEEGDFLYLYYNGMEYTYEYRDTVITHNRDWDYIKTNEYSTLTLQSCHPVNVATQRIFAYGYLTDVRTLTKTEVQALQQDYPAFSPLAPNVMEQEDES